MRSGAAADHSGYFHELAFYESDAGSVDLVAPFVVEGAEAGEPTVVACHPQNTALLEAAVGDVPGIVFLAGADQYSRPAETVATYLQMFADFVVAGAGQVRVVGDVPHPGTGFGWDVWARYEAAANALYADFPLWGLCPYDVRTTPPAVVDDLVATHPHIADGGDHRSNQRFRSPGEFLSSRPIAVPDPAIATTVAVQPSCAEGRALTRVACRDAGLPDGMTDDLVLAVSGVVANAHVHGVPPVELRLFGAPDHVQIVVSDAGPGPADPSVGLTGPPSATIGRRGLWTVHRLGVEIAMGRTDTGFSVRLSAGGG